MRSDGTPLVGQAFLPASGRRPEIAHIAAVPRGRQECLPHKNAGFTLLEVLLSLGIMAIIAVALFASMHVAFKSRDAAESRLEPARSAEAVMDLIRAEFESALPPRGNMIGAFSGASFQSGGGMDDDEVSFYTTNPAPTGVVVAPAELNPTPFTVAGAPGDVKHVQLRLLVEEGTGRKVLVRRVTSNLLSPLVLQPDDEILCRGVTSFDVIYCDGSQWWTTWDSSLENDSLPTAVQVTLELDPPTTGRNAGNARGPRIARTIQLPCTGEGDPSDDTGATSGGGDETGAAGESGGTGGTP